MNGVVNNSYYELGCDREDTARLVDRYCDMYVLM